MNLEELINHPDPLINKIAVELSDLQTLRKSGSLTEAGYKAACDELLDVEKIAKDAGKADLEQEVKVALQALIQIARMLV